MIGGNKNTIFTIHPSLFPRSFFNMADAREPGERNKENIFASNTTFTSIIPMMEELRRQKGPIDILPGLPQAPRPPQQIKIENIMESCVFKSTLAGVLGETVRHVLLIFKWYSFIFSAKKYNKLPNIFFELTRVIACLFTLSTRVHSM